MTVRADEEQAANEPTEKRLALERERDQIFERIRSYPSPITACDEQFDYLLEERDRIVSELARARQAETESNQS